MTRLDRSVRFTVALAPLVLAGCGVDPTRGEGVGRISEPERVCETLQSPSEVPQCLTKAEWTAFAEDSCQHRSGRSVGELTFASPCARGFASLRYTCCTGIDPPPPHGGGSLAARSRDVFTDSYFPK